MAVEPSDLESLAPHSTEAEQRVLGSCLMDTDTFLAVAQQLRASDFFHERHRLIVEAMVQLATRDEPIGFLQVSEELTKHGKLQAVGGDAYLAKLLTAVPISP